MKHPDLIDSPAPSDASCPPPIVLHVEDDQDFSAALRIRLESHGVAVIRTDDGSDGIRQLKNRRVDAILVDYELPDQNGDELVKEIRQMETMEELPIIVITGRKSDALRVRMRELGASGFLTKPVRFDDLRRELAEFIDILPCRV